ncbi:hypothetical protein K466DRAFT_651659 [Polyporus arcularius HHB13444]|uniref:Uncharacterized protein n=1 Tax=Polyporus arcularius HHB13444 TaxID=1314778 RepID=A0A5C3PKE7_9APHY|nr:hypothetical protein K466DRAFT_651659 [Polyporus arcularius HHB13444]
MYLLWAVTHGRAPPTLSQLVIAPGHPLFHHPMFGTTYRTAWDIYASELKSHGYGHPMWFADPSTDGPIQLGDIGFFDDGRFYLLFNCIKPDPHRDRQCPTPFVPFTPPEKSMRGPDERINEPHLYSKRKRNLHVAAGASGGVRAHGAKGGADVSHKEEETSVASLDLVNPAKKTFLDCTGLIEKYVETHCDTWVKCFKDKKLARKKFVFVHGVTMTRAWKATAWERRKSSDRMSLWARAQSFVGVGGKVWYSDSHDTEKATNHNPDRDIGIRRDNESEDQCIFVNFYRSKTRRVIAQRIKRSLPQSGPTGPRSPKANEPGADEGAASSKPGTPPDNLAGSNKSPGLSSKRSQDPTRPDPRGGRRTLMNEKRTRHRRPKSSGRASPRDRHDSDGQRAPGPLEAAEDFYEPGEWADDSRTDVDASEGEGDEDEDERGR